MNRFEGRVAVVSGAAQGMGKAVALRLAEEGATVVAADINGKGAEATAKEIAPRFRRCSRRSSRNAASSTSWSMSRPSCPS
jgi:NAD(P)-dependent dehydrogenase (short-subunit alcohol dehydrogenase family)